MCQAFSAIVTREGNVLWKAGLDSHDQILEHFKIKDDTASRNLLEFARVEITPTKGYLYPYGGWSFQIDEKVKPTWWRANLEFNVRKSLVDWKNEIYSNFDYKQARTPLNPLKGKEKQPNEDDMANLKKWASVGASIGASGRASVWDSVWNSVGASIGASGRASVWDSVWASVGAYIGSLFTLPQWSDGYPYQSSVDLWKRGFMPSFDGKTWRLHSGKIGQRKEI